MSTCISVDMNMNNTIIVFMGSDINKATCFMMLGTFTLVVPTTIHIIAYLLIATCPLTLTLPPTEGKARKLTVFTCDRGRQKGSGKETRLVHSPGLTLLICLD